MKKTLLLLAFIAIMINVNAQKKDRIIQATDSLITDGVLTVNGNDFDIESASTDGQFLRKVSGKWINQDFSSAGTDSLTFDGVYGLLKDYRGGSVFKETEIQYENFYLENGGARIITIRYADAGSDGDDLTIKAGDNEDNLGGGDLWLRGGGTYEEYGDVNIGANLYDETNYSLVHFWDTIYMNGNAIRGLNEAVHDDEPVVLSQLSGLTKNIYAVSLPYSTTVQGRVAGAVQGDDYPSSWMLSAATNQIDIIISHLSGRRVANVNVCAVSSNTEQLLRPFAGAYSGWSTVSDDDLIIHGLATIPLPIKIYLSFE